MENVKIKQQISVRGSSLFVPRWPQNIMWNECTTAVSKIVKD